MKDVDFIEGFEFTTEAGSSYFAKLVLDKVEVTWVSPHDGVGRTMLYDQHSVKSYLQDGTWRVVRHVYQVGFSDGTWRDVSKDTFDEVKSWPSTHATRIIKVI